MEEKQPNVAVWLHLLFRPMPMAAVWRLSFYFKRRYGAYVYGAETPCGQIGYLRVTAVESVNSITGGGVATQSHQMPFAHYLFGRHGEAGAYSLTLPLQRLKPRRAHVLMSDGQPHPVRIEPATGAAFGIDFDLYDVLATSCDAELITDPVAREHAEALIHMYDEGPSHDV